jgi:transmembrane sensor
MESKSTREETENAAAAWLLRRGDAQWTGADQIELDRWLAASVGHRVSFMRLQAIWSDTERLKSVSAGLAKGQIPPRGAIEQSPFFTIKRRDALEMPDTVALPLPRESAGAGTSAAQRLHGVRKMRALAASVVLAFGAAAILYASGYLNRSSTFETPIGGVSTVPIEDGSIVTLNTDSEMEVRFSDRERRIKLKRGEAFFDVAKDRQRPFVVYAGERRVVAVGTKFSVRLNSNAVRVAVTEGRVRLEERAPLERSTNLAAGAVADIEHSHVEVKRQTIAAIEQTLGWRAGYVIFDETPLAEAVAEFNRYNERQIVIDDPSLQAIRVEGNFRATNINGFVRLLEQGFRVRAEQAQDGKVVLSRKQ